jgi:hypothetical protein
VVEYRRVFGHVAFFFFAWNRLHETVERYPPFAEDNSMVSLMLILTALLIVLSLLLAWAKQVSSYVFGLSPE